MDASFSTGHAPDGLDTRDGADQDTATVSRFRARSVLVTGGAGFLGSHLCDRLLEKGFRVIAWDDLSCGSTANLRAAHASPDFRFRERDVAEADAAEAVDLVLNMACPASPPRYQADPIGTMRTCVLGALNLGALAVARRARLIHASTSEVYGDPEVHPQVESYRGSVNPIGPRACYDEGKRAAETILFDLHRTEGLDLGIARIFNTYGPRMDPFDGRVVSNLIRQALTDGVLTVYGDGRQTRSFCYVDDTVDALVRLALAGPNVTGPINVGNPREMTILELAEAVREIVGRRCDIVFKPLPVDDPTRRRPDISRASAELGWAPQVPLEDGLRRTIDYFDDLIRCNRLTEYSIENARRFGVAAE